MSVTISQGLLSSTGSRFKLPPCCSCLFLKSHGIYCLGCSALPLRGFPRIFDLLTQMDVILISSSWLSGIVEDHLTTNNHLLPLTHSVKKKEQRHLIQVSLTSNILNYLGSGPTDIFFVALLRRTLIHCCVPA